MERSEFLDRLNSSQYALDGVNYYQFELLKEYCLEHEKDKAPIEVFLQELQNPVNIASGIFAHYFIQTLEYYKQKFEVMTIYDKSGKVIHHI
jgi:uncharacterized membrane protein